MKRINYVLVIISILSFLSGCEGDVSFGEHNRTADITVENSEEMALLLYGSTVQANKELPIFDYLDASSLSLKEQTQETIECHGAAADSEELLFKDPKTGNDIILEPGHIYVRFYRVEENSEPPISKAGVDYLVGDRVFVVYNSCVDEEGKISHGKITASYTGIEGYNKTFIEAYGDYCIAGIRDEYSIRSEVIELEGDSVSLIPDAGNMRIFVAGVDSGEIVEGDESLIIELDRPGDEAEGTLESSDPNAPMMITGDIQSGSVINIPLSEASITVSNENGGTFTFGAGLEFFTEDDEIATLTEDTVAEIYESFLLFNLSGPAEIGIELSQKAQFSVSEPATGAFSDAQRHINLTDGFDVEFLGEIPALIETDIVGTHMSNSFNGFIPAGTRFRMTYEGEEQLVTLANDVDVLLKIGFAMSVASEIEIDSLAGVDAEIAGELDISVFGGDTHSLPYSLDTLSLDGDQIYVVQERELERQNCQLYERKLSARFDDLSTTEYGIESVMDGQVTLYEATNNRIQFEQEITNGSFTVTLRQNDSEDVFSMRGLTITKAVESAEKTYAYLMDGEVSSSSIGGVVEVSIDTRPVEGNLIDRFPYRGQLLISGRSSEAIDFGIQDNDIAISVAELGDTNGDLEPNFTQDIFHTWTEFYNREFEFAE